MEAKVSGKNIVIKLDIETLVTAFDYKEDNQDQYKVKYKRKFAQGLCDLLQSESGSSESGLTLFQDMLDNLFYEMTCTLPDYIKVLDEDFE